MSLIERQDHSPVSTKKAGVRVKLERINCDLSRSLPPDGDHPEWLDRLKAALGTASVEFIDATLYQLQAAARLPNGGVSEIAVNSALAMIESEQPKNETECAIVIQMACLHSATPPSASLYRERIIYTRDRPLLARSGPPVHRCFINLVRAHIPALPASLPSRRIHLRMTTSAQGQSPGVDRFLQGHGKAPNEERRLQTSIRRRSQFHRRVTAGCIRLQDSNPAHRRHSSY